MGVAAEIVKLRAMLEQGFIVTERRLVEDPAYPRMTHEQDVRAVSVDRAIESLAASSAYRTRDLLLRAEAIAKFVTDGTVPSGDPATQ